MEAMLNIEAYKELLDQLKTLEAIRQENIALRKSLDEKTSTPEVLLNIEAYKELLNQLRALEEIKQENTSLRESLAEKTSILDKLNKIQKVFCRICKHKNNHIELDYKRIILDEDDEGNSIKNLETWQLQCLGCYTIVNKEQISDKDWNHIGKAKFNPEMEKWFLEPKTIFDSLEHENLKKTYFEAIECFNKEMEIPCSITIRTLIEGIGIFCGIKQELLDEGKNPYSIKIEDMVDRMVRKGIITINVAEILKELRFLGNEAAHSMIRHPKPELKLAIQIVENVIENIFVIPKVAESLKKISDERKAIS